MEKYCGECGRKIDEKTGLCPYCDKKEPDSRKPKKVLIAVVAVICSLSLIASGIFGVLMLTMKAPDDAVTKGELLKVITERFGMYSYSDESPHTETVNTDNMYFPYVQIAYEWGLISDKKIDVNDKVTKGFLAETLVKCVGFVDTSDMSGKEISDYAAENNYVSFPYKGILDNKKYVTAEDIQNSIEKSVSVWTDREFENKENISLKDSVCNLSESVLASQVLVDESEKTITLPEDVAKQIEEGEAFVVPANNVDTTMAAYKAQQIEYSNGYAIIKYSDVEYDDVIDELELSGSVKADFDKIPVIDGAGNVINSVAAEGLSANVFAPEIKTAALTPENNYDIMPCVNAKFEFSKEGLSVSGALSDGKISFDITGEFVTKNKNKITVSEGFEVSDISLDCDLTGKKSGGKSCFVKINYNATEKASVSSSWEKKGAVFFDQRKKPTLSNILNSEVRASAAEEGAKTIKICTIPIVNGGIARIDIDIKVRISITGSVELIVGTNNVQGGEIKNGKFRIINDRIVTDKDFNIKAKIELTLYLGLAIKVLKINLFGIGIEGGAGAQFVTTMHLVNSENIEIDRQSMDSGNFEYIEETLSSMQDITYSENDKSYSAHIDVCADLTTYWIFRIKIDEDCSFAKILKGTEKESGGKYKLEIEVLGKDNAPIEGACCHIENGKIVDACTRKYDGSIVPPDTNENEDNNKEPAPDNNQSGVISPETAVDIYMQNKNLWMRSKDYSPMCGYGYCLLDLDFDGVLELILSECDGTGRYSFNRFFRINTDSSTVEEFYMDSVSEVDNHADYYYRADSIKLLKNSDDNSLFYLVDDYVHVSMQEGSVDYVKCYMQDGKMCEKGLFTEIWQPDYDNNDMNTQVRKYIFMGEYVSQTEYEQKTQEFYAENKNMNLVFNCISGYDFEDADDSTIKTLLLDAYRSFSYDGFSFGSTGNQNTGINLEAYEDALALHPVTIPSYTGSYYYDTEYTLYDINNNGSPELIVKEKEKNYYVYTLDNGECKSCGDSFDGYQNGLYACDSNGIIVYNGGMGNMRAEYLDLYILQNNGELIWSESIITTELGATYQEIQDVIAELIPIDDFYPITDYTLLNNYSMN